MSCTYTVSLSLTQEMAGLMSQQKPGVMHVVCTNQYWSSSSAIKCWVNFVQHRNSVLQIAGHPQLTKLYSQADHVRVFTMAVAHPAIVSMYSPSVLCATEGNSNWPIVLRALRTSLSIGVCRRGRRALKLQPTGPWRQPWTSTVCSVAETHWWVVSLYRCMQHVIAVKTMGNGEQW